MKKSKRIATYLVAMASVVMISFTGCEKDNSSSCDWESEYQAYMQKVNAFTANQSRSNCTALKDSALKLINKIGNCEQGVSIKEAAEAWRQVDCSGL